MKPWIGTLDYQTDNTTSCESLIRKSMLPIVNQNTPRSQKTNRAIIPNGDTIVQIQPKIHVKE